MNTPRHDTAISENLRWDEEYDVIVVGFGGAGACAAIEAADRRAQVLVVDRFTGGGATIKSGGVIYAGGGSSVQISGGFRDSADKMYRYLARETGGAVDRRAIRAFCTSSLDNLAWLKKLGVIIPDRYYQGKTTQPPGGYGLYFSGNEKQYTFDDPIPRGHVPDGTGMSGGSLFRALQLGARERGVTIRHRCRPVSIITENGTVTGIDLLSLKNSLPVHWAHTFLYSLGMVSGLCRRLLLRLEHTFGAVTRVRARGGVIISAGGFVYNRSMMEKHAPRFAGCMPLGTPGDDGSGIMLGLSAGGILESMDACAASRFFSPPEAFISGILVNLRGERFCDESLYGATLSRHISEQPENRAYLIIDETIMDRAKEQMRSEERLRDFSLSQLLSGEMNALIFRKAMFLVNSRLNREKAAFPADLEKKCSLPAGSLTGAMARYNDNLASGAGDEFGKPGHYREVIGRPPFYAINCRLDSRLFPSPCITLGGLAVNAVTGQVLRGNGIPVPGLYAAGRSAAGVCSRSYVSGLSLADCIFSGRNAGKHAAASSGMAAQSRNQIPGV